VLGRTLLYAGLEKTTPAIASALGNLTPTMTFILALLCRYEDSFPSFFIGGPSLSFLKKGYNSITNN
jgi:drug/metabolite transporter (DMT)-like permease